MEILTSRLKIRDFVKEDMERVHQLVEEPDMYKYQQWGPNSEKDTEVFIEMCISQQQEYPRKSFELAIEDRKTKLLIGAVGMRKGAAINKTADIGYWISKEMWGQGLGTEASKAIIKFGFESLGLHRISATASPHNVASIRVLEKAGMRREGLLRGNFFVRGAFRDSLLLAMIHSDYVEQREIETCNEGG